MTDAELPDDGSKNGIVFLRLAGAAAGAKFAQQYGRLPTKMEVRLESRAAQPDAGHDRARNARRSPTEPPSDS